MLRALVIALTAAVLAPSLAAAQPRPPEPRDYDQDEEEFSEFWERALAPNKKLYEQLLAQARAIASESSNSSQRRAIRMLGDAIKLVPDRPEAYWELGLVYKRRGEWKECAKTLRTVFEIAPTFQPERDSVGTFDLELGACLAHAADHRAAIRHLKRILARGQSTSHAHLLIGQSYMALGELRRAIEYFETAAQTEGMGAVDSHFSLAVAHDRDQRHEQARLHLDRALARDPSLSRLAARNDFIPEADRFYYLGLGYSSKHAHWAIIYFRHYLEKAGTSPWRSRAEEHLSDLSNEFRREWPIVVTGSASVDAPDVRRALARKRDELEACVANAPELLLRIKIKRVAKRSGAPSGLIPGVTVLVDYAFASDTSAVEQVVACVDRVAAELELPPLSGPAGSFAVVSIPVLKLAE